MLILATGSALLTFQMEGRAQSLKEKDLKNALPEGIDYTYRFSVYGHLFNWTAGIELHYRF